MRIQYKCPVCGCTEYYEILGAGQPKISETKEMLKDKNNYGKTKTTIREEHPKSLIEHYLTLGRYSDATIDEYYINVNAVVCLCKKCGHIDLFNPRMAESISKAESKFKEELDAKEKDLKEAQKKQSDAVKLMDELSNKIRDVAKLLADENITIKQHRELKEQAELLNEEFPEAKKKLEIAQAELEQVRKEIQELKKKLDAADKLPNVNVSSRDY